MKHILIISIVLCLIGLQCAPPSNEKNSSPPEPFETAEVYFEQNTTDGDAEVVFTATAGDMGLISLQVVAPDDRVVIDYRVSDTTTIGIRKFQLESPEPEDIEAVKEAYPSGTYKFSGTDTDGTEYLSEAILDHTIPPPIDILHPTHGMIDVDIRDLEITWSPIADAEFYLIEVENEDSGLKIEAALPGSETSFLVSGKFLQPDTEYKVVVGIKSSNGNLNFTEISFTTLEE